MQKVLPNVLSKDDWCYLYRDQVYPFIDEEIFRELYPSGTGRPNTSIKKNAARNLFKQLTQRFIDACGTSTKKQRTDSFFMQGWLQTLSRYGLFKETLRVFLQNLRKQKPGLYEDVSKGFSRNYLDKEFDLTEKDREKAQREVKRMAQDLYVVYTAFDKHHQVNQYESFKTLVTVFQQQCEVVENPEKTVREVVIREKPVGDEIISTPHNTDARYAKKGKQVVCGQKSFLTKTCDKNNKTQFITDVGVTPATTADVKELPAIQERLEEGKVNTRCPVKIGAGVATLTIDEASYVGAARHHQYMENTDYRKRCAIRAGAEATVSEMVRAHGVRRSKHRTEGRTRLRVIFAAIACNVKRFIRHGVLHGYVMSANVVTTSSAAVSVVQTALNSFFLHVLSFIYVSGRKSPHFSILKTKTTVSAGFQF